VEIHDRTTYLENLFNHVAGLVTEFRKDHAEMRKILKEMISFKGFNTERMHDFNVLMTQIKTNQKRREQDTSQMLADFNQAHDAMSRNLSDMLATMKSDLVKSDQDRHHQAQEDLQKRLGYLGNMKTEISNMLTTLQAESQEAMREWSDLSRILEEKLQKENATKPKAAAQPKEKSAKPPMPVISETAPATDFSNGEAKAILVILKENSKDGIRLVDLSKKLDKKWQTLIPQMKYLLENGQIKKEDNLYFPA
jgi:hypothetical protein